METPEETAKRRAEAIRKAMIEAAVGQINENKIDISEVQSVFDALSKETDRGISVLAFAYLDSLLESIFRKILDNDVEGGVQSLLHGFGPLATAGNRIQLAFAIGWISERSYKQARLLKKIRDRFAHNPHIGSFEHPDIKVYLDQMFEFEKEFNDILDEIGVKLENLSDHTKFQVRSIISITLIVLELSSARFAERHGLHGLSVISARYSDWPDWHRELWEIACEACEAVLRRAQNGKDD